MFFRVAILDDVYRPHTYEEVEALVSPEVASRLDPEQLYGIWWYNRLRVRTRQVSEPSENGRRYRTEARCTVKPEDEWVAVPVPYAGIPREVVDAAIKDNRRASSAGRRFWELSGGILRCGLCEHTTATRSIRRVQGRSSITITIAATTKTTAMLHARTGRTTEPLTSRGECGISSRVCCKTRSACAQDWMR